MSYLIVGNNKENISNILRPLISKLWERDIKDLDILSSGNPDIHILEGEELNSIGIEDIKKLQQEMMYTPFKEKVQIALLTKAEKLTTQAQNSLLKTLEDSSSTTAYILITENEKTILPTVLSRCLKLYTHSVIPGNESEISLEILNMDIISTFQEIERISKSKESTEQLLRALELHFQQELERNLIEKRGIIEVAENVKQVLIAQRRVKANGNKRLVLENLFLHLTK